MFEMRKEKGGVLNQKIVERKGKKRRKKEEKKAKIKEKGEP